MSAFAEPVNLRACRHGHHGPERRHHTRGGEDTTVAELLVDIITSLDGAPRWWRG